MTLVATPMENSGKTNGFQDFHDFNYGLIVWRLQHPKIPVGVASALHDFYYQNSWKTFVFH